MDEKGGLLGDGFQRTEPRLIIHGGAGPITRKNLSRKAWKHYHASLLSILRSTRQLLQDPKTTAIDAATHAVTLLENDALFNSGHGAVFTRAGTNELEASVMVSRGLKKRGCGVMLLQRVKNPVLLAKELLLRGGDDEDQLRQEKDGSGRENGGAYSHNQLSGPEAEKLAEQWGLEVVDPSYFWTKPRWDEHRRELERERGPSLAGAIPIEDEYLPKGTVGAVVMDRTGTLCVATSTGGFTNKLPGRIGDSASLGAGFWAEEWAISPRPRPNPSLPLRGSQAWIPQALQECLSLDDQDHQNSAWEKAPAIKRAIAVGGTGNGDYFLRMAACHTVSSITRYSRPLQTLQSAVSQVAGPGGDLQRSAGSRWGQDGDGQGGIIGIDVVEDDEGIRGRIVLDFNCAGMFRAWIDDDGREHCMIFKEEY